MTSSNLNGRRKKILSRESICKKAKEYSLDPEFKASVGWFYRFCKRHDLVKRARTHSIKKIRTEVFQDVVKHLEDLRTLRVDLITKKIPGYENVVFCNADEVPVQIDTYGYTYDFRGKKEIACFQPQAGKVRFTVLLAILSTGDILPPTIIFKSSKAVDQLQEKYKGLVQIYHSPNAWVNGELAKQWLRKVWKSYKAPAGFKRALIWDQFSAHKMADVTSLAKSMGELFFIPAGCTDLIQPLDTHINRIVKAKFRKLYTEYVNENESEQLTKAGNLKLPPLESLVDWIIQGVLKVSSTTIKSAFDYCGRGQLSSVS